MDHLSVLTPRPSIMPRLSALTVSLGLLTGLGAGALQGCKGAGDGIAEQCGLDINCEAGGIAEGNASISGIPSLDAFFGAVIDLDAKIGQVDGTVRAELDAIAASVGLPAGTAGAEIAGAIETRISAAVSGGLTIRAEPARCEASVEVMASATAECDVEADPGEVSFACEGSCEVEAGVMADCGAEAELHCTVSAPSVECSGMCQGTCSADGGVQCNGTCKGGCEAGSDGPGECSVVNADGTCNGTCNGTCTGSCELEVAAECAGSCEGSCDVVEPSGMCDASAQARCEAQAGGSVQCEAGCEGKAEPPEVSAECEASVEAKASASVVCTPPTVAIDWEWSGEFASSVESQAQFRAWINQIRVHYSAILAARAQADLLLEAGEGLITAAGGAVTDAAADLEGNASLRVVFGARCAAEQLGEVETTLRGGLETLTASVTAVGQITASLGG